MSTTSQASRRSAGCKHEKLSPLLATSLSDAFVQSLGADEPEHCFHFYLGFLHIVGHEEGQELHFLRYRRPDILKTIYLFLTKGRTTEDVVRTQMRLQRCSCSRTDEVAQGIHTSVQIDADNYKMDFLIRYLCSFLGRGLHWQDGDEDEDEPVTEKAHIEDEFQAPWPAEDGSDVWLREPATTLAMLWQLYNLYHVPTIFYVMEGLNRATTPPDAKRPPLPLHLVPQLPAQVIMHLQKLSATVQDPLSQQSIQNITAILSLALQGRIGSDEERETFWKTHAHNFLLVFSQTIKKLKTVGSEETDALGAQLSETGGVLVLHFKEDLDLSMYTPSIIAGAAQLSGVTADPFVGAHWSVGTLVRQSCCFRAGCKKAVVLGEGGGICQRCRGARYCSADCQNKAWKDKQAPHKLVCDAMAVYSQKMKAIDVDWEKYEDDPAEMKADSERAGITKEEATLVYLLITFFSTGMKWENELKMGSYARAINYAINKYPWIPTLFFMGILAWMVKRFIYYL